MINFVSLPAIRDETLTLSGYLPILKVNLKGETESHLNQRRVRKGFVYVFVTQSI